MRILILEDEAVIAEGLYQLLLQLEYEPLDPVATVAEAIALVEESRPDLCILDITLQDGRSGVEVAAWIAKNRPSLPFIMLTAHSDAATVTEVKQHRPAAYLIKPFMKESLFAAIELASPGPVSDEAEDTSAENGDNGFFIKIGTRHERVDLSNIVSLQAAGKYTELHFATQPRRLVRMPLSQFIETFPAVKWLRVHKSHAVNPAAISWVGTDELEAAGLRIPIGRFFQPEVEAFVNRR